MKHRWDEGSPEHRLYYHNREHQQGQFRAVAKHLPSGSKHLLDVGCGYGDFTSCLPADYTYKGIDARPNLVALARELYPGFDFEYTTAIEPADVIVAVAAIQSEFVPPLDLWASMCTHAPLVIATTGKKFFEDSGLADSALDVVEPAIDDDWILLVKGHL